MRKNISKYFFLLILSCFSAACSSDESAMSDVINNSGQGGSMARFTIAGNHLYVVDERSLHVYDVSVPTAPEKKTRVSLGVNIETIFPYQGKLFIGSMNGMHIYDIAEPETPRHLSTYVHITSCDPVVVKDSLAFVTLRSGTNCRMGSNQLDIINIKDPTTPRLITSYPMQSPYGLGIEGNTLFLCEGDGGLKVLDVSDINDVTIISWEKNIHAFDVIPRNNNLILTGDDGVFQYNYSDPQQLVLNSQLTSNNCE